MGDSTLPYFYICMMKRCLDVICPRSEWHGRVKALISNFPNLAVKVAKLEDFGVIEDPNNWSLWD